MHNILISLIVFEHIRNNDDGDKVQFAFAKKRRTGFVRTVFLQYIVLN